MAAFGASGAEAPALSLLGDLKIPLWYEDVNVRGGFGYKDNVLLSSVSPQGSAFWTAGGDVLAYRLPTDGWQFSGFASFDNLGYFDRSTGVNNEQSAITMAQGTKDLGKGWKMGLGASYMFEHQVLDVSVTQTNQYTNTEVLGNSVVGHWFVRKDLKPYWVDADLSVMRQWLAAPLDSFLQSGPRLTIGRSLNHGSDVTLSYQWLWVGFDTREQVTAAGYLEPGTSLRFQNQLVEMAWHQVWDENSHWHAVTRAGLNFNQDNGSGYFDFWQYRLAEQVKYKGSTWEISALGRVDYYDFPVQTVSATDPALRRKTMIGATLRAEKHFGKSWKVFAAYAYDRSLSNVTSDSYQANTTSVGVEYRF
jgi:hypothetical protein